ncbi:hypothetical protein [Rhodococcus sp. RS1C4]|nr:hypothetical protein [Rhodococcus sp. RS1C4]
MTGDVVFDALAGLAILAALAIGAFLFIDAVVHAARALWRYFQ